MIGTIRMKTIFVPMAKRERAESEKQAQRLQDETRQLPDQEIMRQASQYEALREQANGWLPDAEDRFIAGSKETKYLKKLGHRTLSKADVETLVRALGNDEQKELITAFERAQAGLSKRLAAISNLGLVLNQAGVNYNTYYLRLARPELWKADEMIAIMAVVERLKL